MAADEPTPASRQPDCTAEFVRLLRQHDRRLAAYVHSLVPNWSEADDVIQETSIRLWEQFDRFDRNADFGAWACTIAKYMVLTSRQKSRNAHQYFRDEVLDLMGTTISTVDDEVSERHEALQLCVEKLPAKGRDLLTAYYASEMSPAEVAASSGRTTGAVYTSLSRIRRQLQECIERHLRREDRP